MLAAQSNVSKAVKQVLCKCSGYRDRVRKEPPSVLVSVSAVCCMPSLMQLVYEKEKRLRMMIKMHGLGDTAYWLVMYSWFLLLYVAYMCVFVFFGSIIGLNIFTQNNYGESQPAFEIWNRWSP